MTYGYARVSTVEQNEARQLIALKNAGVDEAHTYVDKASGKDFLRPMYQKLRRKLKKGDLLIVQSLDRFGRCYDDIIDEWRYLVKQVGVDVKVLDMPLLDTRQGEGLIGRFVGDIVLQILSFVAEMERRKIKERQAQGIAAARARGVRFGRPSLELPENIEEELQLYRDKKLTLREAAKECGLSSSSFWRLAQSRGIVVKKYESKPVPQDVPEQPKDDGSPKKGKKPSVEWVMSLPPQKRWKYAKHWTKKERLEAQRIEMKRIEKERGSSSWRTM
jgi:DNA invertase Pin-like site-specific DNA recombinase